MTNRENLGRFIKLNDNFARVTPTPIMSLKVFLVLALATCVLAQPKEDEDTFCEEDNCYEGA